MKSEIIMFGVKATLERWHFLPVERLIHYNKEWSLEETIAMKEYTRLVFICFNGIYEKNIAHVRYLWPV